MKKLAVAALLIGLLVVGFLVRFIDQRLPVGVGLTAKQLCSLVFVSGMPIEQARFVYMDPWLEPFRSLISHRQLDTGVEVRGLWRSARADHREGLGCTLVHAKEPLASPPERTNLEAVGHSFEAAAEEVAAQFDRQALDAALDRAFAEPADAERPLRQTMAVLVQHRGRVVAERYADGIGPRTPLPGWSMTKSIATTLVGLLVRDGMLQIEAPGAVEEWRGQSDPRASITLDQLLRMTSGYDIKEDYSGTDPASQMLFARSDAAAYSAMRPLQADPGMLYEYMSGSTVLATRRAQEVLGGLNQTVEYLDRELFGPLGLRTAVIEADQSGTWVGSSFMFASARDWAQLGQLYLNGGQWQGRQLLPVGWSDYVSRHTELSGDEAYGAGFWLASAPGGDPRGLPADTYAMNGFQGQYVVIVPSADLVVVRLGAALVDPLWRELVTDVVASMRAEQAVPQATAETAG